MKKTLGSFGIGSLRVRFVLPHLAAALLAALGVAVISASLGRSWALRDVKGRVKEIELTLNDSTVPLTAPVLNSAADLTGTELITLEQRREISQSTIALTESEHGTIGELLEPYFINAETPYRELIRVEIAGRRYLVFPFERKEASIGRDRVRHVLVLADAEGVDAAGERAALLPLATGFSCILLLTTLTIVISNHLVKRLITLQRSVQKVAGGDFDATVADSSTDEVGQLGRAVDAMAGQLKSLWSQVNRQQSERLLHLIAGGMAHQLRNTLTGARMAVELHSQQRVSLDGASEGASEGDELKVALRELDVAEDYVRRLLLVSAGKSQEERPELISKCLREVYATHAAVAKHLRVTLRWPCHDKPDDGSNLIQANNNQVEHAGGFVEGFWVADGAAFSAAISNLVLNAMQAAEEVDVRFWVCEESTIDGNSSGLQRIVVRVEDNGPGIDSAVEAELFEPFVTSKPEGMGLGLALVKRSAEQLGGGVTWKREMGPTESVRTVFEFTCRVFDGAPNR